MRSRLGPFLVGLVGALIGTVVILVSWHLWSDHQALHVVVDFLNQHAGKIQKLP